MKTQFTPGPWRSGDRFNTVFGPNLGKPSPETIATVFRGNEANARLIAAAPELLEALQILVDHAQEQYPHFESERGQRDIARALNAIYKAKAEGRK